MALIPFIYYEMSLSLVDVGSPTDVVDMTMIYHSEIVFVDMASSVEIYEIINF